MHIKLGLTACTICALAACGSSQPPQRAMPPSSAAMDWTTLVNPYVGTQAGAADFGTGGGAGNTFPGATLPFGMLQFSPDTYPSTDNYAGGYTYSDALIKGFSLTHISGAGCALLQDIPVMPYAGDVSGAPVIPGTAGLVGRYHAAFDHAQETAQPGYYKVRLNPASATPIDVELSTGLRSGMARFRFASGSPATLLVNPGGSAMANSAAHISIDAAHQEISGSASSGRFCFQDNRYTVYFVAQFDRPFKNHATWTKLLYNAGGTQASDFSPLPLNYSPIPGGPGSIPGNPSGTAQAGAVLGFDVGDAPLHMRVAISYVSVDNARANLEQELPGWDFDALRAQAHAAWNDALGRIEVSGATQQQRRIFYTALYHSLLSPSIYNDVNRQYLGMDGAVHSAGGYTQYQTFSGWDIYRTQIPLLAMLDAQRTSDMMQSLVADAQHSGWLPKWSYGNQHTSTMTGDPADPMIASAHAFGARNFDTGAALDAMLKGATQFGVSSNPASLNNAYVERPGLPFYQALGYIPRELDQPLGGISEVVSSQLVWGSVSTTLEYALADFSIAQFADALGRGADASVVRARGANWKQLLNPASGYLEPKLAAGIFLPGFDPAGGGGYVEGSGAQYSWFVPHDSAGLIAAIGGKDAATARLDEFFADLNAGPKSAHAYLGNEPTLYTPWLYAWLGQPAKTQPIVRTALTTLYDDAPTGMPGNDDLGTMSAWWVLAALGFDPGIPGTDVLLLNSPLFADAAIHRTQGDIHIRSSGDGIQVQSLNINGQPRDRAWLRFAELMDGGTLDYQLSNQASAWATAAGAEPPSFPAE